MSGIYFDKKKINLELMKNLPVSIELVKGDIKILPTEKEAYLEIENYSIQNLEIDLNVTCKDKNYITFKYAEFLDTKLIFYLPIVIPSFEIVLLNGNFMLSDFNGIFKLDINNGYLRINQCKGSLNITNLNGDTYISDFSGEIQLQSANGGVKVIDWEANGGNIQASNGKIILICKECHKDVEIKALNGKISLGLTKGNPCTIIARGTDVHNYLDEVIKGAQMGSPAKIEWEGGGKKINVFSRTKKVIVASRENIANITPDLESIINELEDNLKQNFNSDSFSKNLKDFSGHLEKWGKRFVKNIQESFNNKDNNKSNPGENMNSNERMEILKMLKEGKISVDEAEKLLNSLK